MLRPSFLSQLEDYLVKEYNNILKEEELYWFQNASGKWLVEGERNTHFFHTSAVLKKQKRKVAAIKDVVGKWCVDQLQLQHMFLDFFQTLYTTEPCGGCDASTCTFPRLTRVDTRCLNHVVSPHKVKDAVFHMGVHKAPGHDGLT